MSPDKPGNPGQPGEEELRQSQPNATGPDGAAGDMGVSSERVGPGGETDGMRDTTPQERDPDADVPPEQRPGQIEENPEGIPPKSGYSSVDPRADDEV